MSPTTLTATYEGANLRAEACHAPPGLALMINGLERDRVAGAHKPGASFGLRVSSVVQTGYEWHEQIEARATWTHDTFELVLYASNVEVARTTEILEPT